MGGDIRKIGSVLFSMVTNNTRNDKSKSHLTVIANNNKTKKE